MAADKKPVMAPSPPPDEPYGKSVSATLVAWLCLAAIVGLEGWLERTSAPVIAAIVWTLTGLVLLGCWRVTSFREWAMTVDLRWFVVLHLTRFVGFYFFYLCARGQLPYSFAAPAGIGDVAVACFAVLLLALPSARQWKILVIWNTLGLTDILFVVFTALRVGLENWQSMHSLREFPLSLLILFLVPLIIASHVLIFFRAARALSKRKSEGDA